MLKVIILVLQYKLIIDIFILLQIYVFLVILDHKILYKILKTIL